MRPTSRGYIKLKSKDPREHPEIDPNYLDTGKIVKKNFIMNLFQKTITAFLHSRD